MFVIEFPVFWLTLFTTVSDKLTLRTLLKLDTRVKAIRANHAYLISNQYSCNRMLLKNDLFAFNITFCYYFSVHYMILLQLDQDVIVHYTFQIYRVLSVIQLPVRIRTTFIVPPFHVRSKLIKLFTKAYNLILFKSGILKEWKRTKDRLVSFVIGLHCLIT